ncbi:MAG TPA: winged helix-turn-helix domain-containing protein [Bryobacteraceae bacterium]|nr:winged helix-turn-helix domain-containing protein [Bryobacteraceae bacterium]
MSEISTSKGRYEFLGFCLDVQERLLQRNGGRVSITPKIFDLLLLFVENANRLLGKEEIMRTVWPDTHIDEATLTRTVSELRKTLGEKAGEANFLQTVPKRGYRFVAPVEIPTAAVPEVGIAVGTVSHSLMSETPPIATANLWRAWRGSVLAVSLAGMVVVLAGIWAFEARFSRASPVTQSIAVLPFQHLENSGTDQFLELGIADTLITRLSGVSALNVRPANAVRKFRDPEQDPVAIGRILKVDTVLDGSVQTMFDQIRVTLRLIRVRDGKPLWAATLDGDSRDLFSLQDSVSREVAQALKLQLSPNERQVFAKRSTGDREAYGAYLKGRFFLGKRTPEGYEKAIDYFQQATRLDSSYALAYAGLADGYLMLQGDAGENPLEATPKARAAAQKALQLDPALGAAHNSLAAIAEDYDRDYPTAEKEFKLAVELDPGFASAHEWYGDFLGLMGRFDQALAEEDRALEIDPLSLTINEKKGKVLLWARHYDQAIQQLQKTLEMDPGFSPALIWLSRAYALRGRAAESLAASEKNNQAQPGIEAAENLAMSYAAAGHKDAAMEIVRELQARGQREYVPAFNLSYVYVFLKQKDKAIEELEIASEKHDINVNSLKIDPLLDPLRSDPRFRELLKRANLGI